MCFEEGNSPWCTLPKSQNITATSIMTLDLVQRAGPMSVTHDSETQLPLCGCSENPVWGWPRLQHFWVSPVALFLLFQLSESTFGVCVISKSHENLFVDVQVHISSFGLGYLLFNFLPGIPHTCCGDCSWRASVCLQKMRVGAGGVEVTIFAPRQETKLFLQSDSIQLTLLLSSSYCRLVWITSILVLLRHFLVVLSPVATQVTATGETTVETLRTAAGLLHTGPCSKTISQCFCLSFPQQMWTAAFICITYGFL